jgi:FKBP-type peptidyl-prolyl cis-trans isomerase FkpA
MIKNLSIFLAVLVLAIGCNKDQETPGGMKFKILKKGDGVKPRVGEIIVFHYQLKDSKDSVWTNTYKDMPVPSQIGDSSQIENEDGMRQMFRLLSKGDSVTTSMTVADFYKKLVRAPVPAGLDSTSNMTYTVSVRDITSVEAYSQSRESEVFEHDRKSIDTYVAENKLTTQKDTSGLQYIIYNNSGGRKPTGENCVEVKYQGRFLKNGRIFDQAERISFPLSRVIAGWQLGIPMLGKGDSGTFFIPSKLAYGQQGIPNGIPPDAVLVFDVTLLDVKNEYDQANRTCK